MSVTLAKKTAAGQKQQYYRYVSTLQLGSYNNTVDEVAKEIPGIELHIPSPMNNEDSIQIVIPSTMYQPSSSKGIVLLLHACTHSALKFFSSSPSTCPNCVGLSEELRIVRLVIASGYIPVAISSIDRKSGCWSAARDVVRIEAVLKHSFISQFINTTRSDDGSNLTPRIIAIGASSGGAFAAELVTRDIVDSALIMVTSLSNGVVTKLRNSPKPIYLAPMSRDIGTTKKVMNNYHDLESVTNFIILDTSTCDSFSLTTRYLIERVPGMTNDAGNELISLLTNGGYIDLTNNRFIIDPTKSNWRTFISPTNDTYWHKFVLTPGYSPLAKALNRAWAFHEYCSETVVPALTFFEKFQPNELGTN
jgi:hypothetical protein